MPGVDRSSLASAVFVPDDQGGHIEFAGKVWRPESAELAALRADAERWRFWQEIGDPMAAELVALRLTDRT